MSNPADLNVVPQPDTNKDYFNFKATGLKIDQTYAIKFQEHLRLDIHFQQQELQQLLRQQDFIQFN